MMHPQMMPQQRMMPQQMMYEKNKSLLPSINNSPEHIEMMRTLLKPPTDAELKLVAPTDTELKKIDKDFPVLVDNKHNIDDTLLYNPTKYLNTVYEKNIPESDIISGKASDISNERLLEMGYLNRDLLHRNFGIGEFMGGKKTKK